MLEPSSDLRIASGLDAETLVREAANAEIVIVRAPLPPALFRSAQKLRAAIRHGAGLDMIPVDAATEAGVLVANVPGVNARSVAEHVFFTAMALLRRFREVDGDLRVKGWLAGREHAVSTHELSGRTLGIVGLGAVGREVAAIGRDGFGLTILGNSRSGEMPAGVRFAELDALIAESDIVVLCCPLTPQTAGLIDAKRIGLMRPGALLINVARGLVVDENALLAALFAGRIRGAALDVFSTQPLANDHPFFGLKNVILTPHMAGITEESMERMGVGAAAEALRVLAGEWPVHLCNPEVRDAYRRRFPVTSG